MSKLHELKTWPGPFQAIVDGTKRFEYRVNDRDYEVGDVLLLREFRPVEEAYTGREVVVHVTYIARGTMYGIPRSYCVMSIAGDNVG